MYFVLRSDWKRIGVVDDWTGSNFLANVESGSLLHSSLFDWSNSSNSSVDVESGSLLHLPDGSWNSNDGVAPMVPLAIRQMSRTPVFDVHLFLERPLYWNSTLVVPWGNSKFFVRCGKQIRPG